MVSPTPFDTDVCVLGAGPAGSCHALRLAQLGYRVTLVERRPFPRSHLGESLTPGVRPLLASLGAGEVLDRAGRVPVRQVDVVWGNHHAPRIDPRATGSLVDRAGFDQALVEVAMRAGVTLLQPAHLQSKERDGAGWRLALTTRSGASTLRARFLSIATGRSGGPGSARAAAGPRTVAVYGYWRGTAAATVPRIQSGPAEWLWSVPLPDGSQNVLVFVDASRLHGIAAPELETWYRAQVETAGILSDTTAATLVSAVRAAEATPYLDEAPVDERHIKIGDAALALDPLSSSGVQKAIQSATAGALVVNTILRRPAASAAAIQFYEDSLARAARRHAAWSANHYAEATSTHPGVFWSARAGGADAVPAEPDQPPPALQAWLGLSSAVRLADEPCLVGDFVESRPAVHHPRLDDPVAFVAGVELAPLLARIPRAAPAAEIARSLANAMPADQAVALTSWLYRNGLLEMRRTPAPAEPATVA
ncbi:MAG: NAD(P)/FAD-dependent oxidoreductase [Gemmatimonadales bacterium]